MFEGGCQALTAGSDALQTSCCWDVATVDIS